MFDYIFADGKLKNYIQESTFDCWIGTNFEGYSSMSSPNKGVFGEMFVEKYMDNLGSEVKERTNKGHDKIIDGHKTEIKFSLGANSKKTKKQRDRVFRINHLSVDKDNDRVIFFGISKIPDESVMVWWNSKDFNDYISSGPGIFHYQQGGKKIKNDDYMFCGDDIQKFLDLDFVKHIDEWTK